MHTEIQEETQSEKLTPVLQKQLDEARELLGRRKIPTSWKGVEEIAQIFQFSLQELKSQHSFQEIRQILQEYYDNLKSR